MYRRAKDFGNRLKRQAVAKKFPITADQLAELAREAVASKPATICPPGEHPSMVWKRLAARGGEKTPTEPR
jgi:hypothetical protein